MARKKSKALSRPENEAIRSLHGSRFAGATLAKLHEIVANEKGTALGATARAFIDDLCETMGARDPLEQMLLCQAIWVHTRIARLTILAAAQTSADGTEILNQAVDRALGTFRRHMLALGEYRNPVSISARTIALVQQNAVVNHPLNEKKYMGNEVQEVTCGPTQKALPAGSFIAATKTNRPRETLAMVNRSADTGGKGSEREKQPKARRILSRGNAAAAGNFRRRASGS